MNRISLFLLNLVLVPGDWLLAFLGGQYRIFRWFLSWAPASLFNRWGKILAWRAYNHARVTVPAYADYTRESGIMDPESFSDIPETDKDRYIRIYKTEDRCVGGKIPPIGTVIDESSGSTGTASNWVRSPEERHVSHGFVSYFGRYCFNLPNMITINGFSMGSWATGLNMGISMQRNGIVKNVGPDVDKILGTIEFFGPKYTYLITGYPPFLKHLIDEAATRNFKFSDYRLFGLVGGEGMSEGLRDYLELRFEKVYSGYGATDLEIGIAGETPLPVAIRRFAREKPELKKALFGDDSRLPMVFYYNPLMHYIEINENRELVFTITRLNVLSPRVRYNIHDEGGVMEWGEMIARCKEAGVDFKELFGNEFASMPKLPFMWIYGRKDSTISVMGANIYPEDLEAALYATPELAQITRSFCMSLHEEANAEVRPKFEFEVSREFVTTADAPAEFGKKITEHLVKLNRDFAEAWHEHPATLQPIVVLWPEGTGPFAQNAGRIKQVRITK